ncbi:hypothetical protein EON82_01015 [bacterium]|nr:MAG: hypothetical protein EON82_01015 [bacterium]
MRHAVWRAGPNDARNFPTYVGQAVRPWGWLVLLVPLILFASSVFFCWPIGLLGMVFTSRKIGAWRRSIKLDELSPLLPDPPPTRLFRSSVTYLNGSLELGEDEIAFSFVDGWLIGQGVRSEFALRRQDVSAVAAPIHGVGCLYLENGQRVRLHELHAYAREAILAWHEASIPVAGEPTFPPIGIEPRQILKTRVRAGADVSLVLVFLWIAMGWELIGALGLVLGSATVLIGLVRLGYDVADLVRYRSILRSEDRRATVA